MAGAGRRSNYRKHLTDHVLNDLPIPTKSQRIAQVQATRGGNQFEIQVEGQEHLALLPAKFHKLVWVKRGDYVIVEKGDEPSSELEGVENASGIRFMIAHILYKEQIKHLRGNGLWPVEFSEDNADEQFLETFNKNLEEGHFHEEAIACDGISYDFVEDDCDLFINTNRSVARMNGQDSESDSEDE